MKERQKLIVKQLKQMTKDDKKKKKKEKKKDKSKKDKKDKKKNKKHKHKSKKVQSSKLYDFNVLMDISSMHQTQILHLLHPLNPRTSPESTSPTKSTKTVHQTRVPVKKKRSRRRGADLSPLQGLPVKRIPSRNDPSPSGNYYY